MKTLAKQMLTERISVRTAGGAKKMTRMDALLHKMVELGMKGNPRMLLGLIQRYEKSVSDNLAIEAEQSSVPLTTKKFSAKYLIWAEPNALITFR